MNPRGLTRRDLLRIAGIGSASLIVGCGDNEGTRDPGNSHAAFVVEPEASSFIVVVWSSLARTAAIEVQSGDAIVFSTVIELAGASMVILALAANNLYLRGASTSR